LPFLLCRPPRLLWRHPRRDRSHSPGTIGVVEAAVTTLTSGGITPGVLTRAERQSAAARADVMTRGREIRKMPTGAWATPWRARIRPWHCGSAQADLHPVLDNSARSAAPSDECFRSPSFSDCDLQRRIASSTGTWSFQGDRSGPAQKFGQLDDFQYPFPHILGSATAWWRQRRHSPQHKRCTTPMVRPADRGTG